MPDKDFSITEKLVREHLRATGANVEDLWVTENSDIFVVTYTVGDKKGTLVVSREAAHVLDDRPGDLDALLLGHRVVDNVGELDESLAFSIQTSTRPQSSGAPGVVLLETTKQSLGLE